MTDALPARLIDHGAALRRLVADYCATQRNGALPPFQVHGPFSSVSAPKSDFAEKPGCYAIYTATGALKYIGMAKQIGYRSVHHFQPVVQQYPFWQRGSAATYIDLIVAQEIWEPHSLEAYLTVRTTDLRQVDLW